jgi:hypothetical protein
VPCTNPPRRREPWGHASSNLRQPLLALQARVAAPVGQSVVRRLVSHSRTTLHAGCGHPSTRPSDYRRLGPSRPGQASTLGGASEVFPLTIYIRFTEQNDARGPQDSAFISAPGPGARLEVASTVASAPESRCKHQADGRPEAEPADSATSCKATRNRSGHAFERSPHQVMACRFQRPPGGGAGRVTSARLHAARFALHVLNKKHQKALISA